MRDYGIAYIAKSNTKKYKSGLKNKRVWRKGKKGGSRKKLKFEKNILENAKF